MPYAPAAPRSPAPGHRDAILPEVAGIFERLAGARRRLAARDEATLAAQVAIAGIPSPSGEEGERGAWIARGLRAGGCRDVTIDPAGNVVAAYPGEGALAPVVVCSHLDTVFPRATALEVRREGMRLVGPGINDNARGLAALLAIGEELARGGVRTRRPVLLVATTGEEGAGDLRGAKHFFATHDAPHAAIALDGAGDDRIVHRALGARRLRVEFHGDGGHSWSAYGTPNPVHAAALCASRIARVRPPVHPRSTISVGRIGGGIAVNAIAEHAWLEVDARSGDRRTLEWLEREIRRAAVAAADEESGRRAAGTRPLRVAVERIGDRPCGETASDDPLVRIAVEATRLVGRTPALAIASTDANVPIGIGIPAIAIGAGGIGGDAHTEQEWYENVEGPLGIGRALAIVVAAATL